TPSISSGVVISLFAVHHMKPSNQNLNGVIPFSSYCSARGPYNASLSSNTLRFTSKSSENKNGTDIIFDSGITSPENPGDVIAISIAPVCKDCKASIFVPNVPAVYTSTSILPSDSSLIVSLKLFESISFTSSCPSSFANFIVILSPSQESSLSSTASATESPQTTKAIDKININTIKIIPLFFNPLFPPLFFLL